MSIEHFVKGTIWETTSPLVYDGQRVPERTRFKVVYPRARESDLVHIAFIDFALPLKAPTNRYLAVRKKRFSKADAIVPVRKLADAKLIDAAGSLEYFIRNIATGGLWAGGRASAYSFRDTPFRDANQFVSLHNAMVGVINLLFQHRNKFKITTTDIPWEIVAINPMEQKIVATHALPPLWWDNVVRVANAADALKQPGWKKNRRAKNSPRAVLRRVANAIPVDDRRWEAAVYVPDSLTTLERALGGKSKTSVTIADEVPEYIKVDHQTSILRTDTDRVLLKLKHADLVEVYQFL
jgi:hypothetical protein